MAWDLLTRVYKVPKERLYVTYFGGSKELNLEPDEECRQIWLDIGYVSSLTISLHKIIHMSSTLDARLLSYLRMYTFCACQGERDSHPPC